MKLDKNNVRIVIFEADTPAGKAFDVALIITILLSVGAVFLDTVPEIHRRWGGLLYGIEWLFTILFTIEYALRLWCIEDTKAYAKSYYGIVDLLGIVPTYLSLLVAGSQYLLVIRILRVLRVFRVLRLVRYVGEADVLLTALRQSRRKITVFLSSVLALVVVFGSVMYLVEGPERGFDSIPRSMYWAVVTLTTVGYGDITPTTTLGRLIASMVMVMGYGIIAVPTSIVTLELNEAVRRRASTRTCPHCAVEGHGQEATYCWRCGSHLYPSSDGAPRE